MLQEIIKLINTKIGVAIITCVVTTALNAVYHKWYIRKEQKMRYENVVGDKIAEALIAVRDIEMEVRTQELYKLEERLKEGNLNMFSPGKIYPAIMSSPQDFFDFLNKVNKARGDYEQYLDYKSAAFLYYIENYGYTLAKYISEHKALDFPTAGTIFYIDLQQWQQQYDRVLVKAINKSRLKLYSKNGWRWERAKKNVMRSLWDNSKLCTLINENENITEY